MFLAEPGLSPVCGACLGLLRLTLPSSGPVTDTAMTTSSDIDLSRVQVDWTTRSECGSFSEVFFGFLDGLPAAFKRGLGHDMDSSGLSDYLAVKEIHMYRFLRHPAIVQCFGSVTVAVHKALVLEHVGGGCLTNALVAGKREKHFPGWSIHVLRDVAAALVHIHSQGYCHGDLQPRNVLLTCTVGEYPDRFSCGQGVAAKLCDLGTLLDVRVKYPDSVFPDVGSTRWNGLAHVQPDYKYAAPETLKYGHGLWTRESDVWSWGVIAWELITGRFPWVELGIPQVRQALLEGSRLEWPEIIPPEFLELKELAAMAMQTDSTARPQSRDLLSSLNALAARVR